MFDEESPGLETDQERSARHSRMVFQAIVFLVVLSALLFGVAAIWVWFRDGSVNLVDLFVPFLFVAIVVGIGLIYELWKRW